MPNITSDTHTLDIGPLTTQGGFTFPSVEVAYEVYGKLSRAGDNALLVCHALTGSARAAGDQGWWDPLIGPGAAFDTDRYAVICTNILGSCYGTTGPASTDPATGQPYASRFPRVSVGDMVAAQRKLLDALGVTRLVTVTGGSLGGLQVIEWAAQAPGFVQSIIPVASNLAHSAWNIAFNEAAREAIRADPEWHGGDYAAHGTSPNRGLHLARMVAMISYRSAPSFAQRFGRSLAAPAESRAPGYDIERYLHYQGDKLVERFDANSYLRITEAMDDYDVATGRGSASRALAPFSGPALVIGIDSDILYPIAEQKELVGVLSANGNDAIYREITSLHGHDAFLIEWGQMDDAVRSFMATLAR